MPFYWNVLTEPSTVLYPSSSSMHRTVEVVLCSVWVFSLLKSSMPPLLLSRSLFLRLSYLFFREGKKKDLTYASKDLLFSDQIRSSRLPERANAVSILLRTYDTITRHMALVIALHFSSVVKPEHTKAYKNNCIQLQLCTILNIG